MSGDGNDLASIVMERAEGNMEDVAGLILMTILMIPLFGIFIWMYLMPEDSILWGRRWMYSEEPEVTDEAIRYTKIVSVISIIVFGLILIWSYIRVLTE